MSRDDIKNLEQSLLDPSKRADRSFLENVLADDFVEIGQSGQKYTKPTVIDHLLKNPGFAGPRSIADFDARWVSDEVVLVTYRVSETGILRSSLWRRSEPGWQMVFHEGTPKVT